MEEITTQELRQLKNIEQYEVFNEVTGKWVDAKDSDYMYDGSIGFSTMEDPYAPINSIAMYHTHQKRMILAAVPPVEYTDSQETDYILEKLDEIAELPTDCNVEVTLFKTEHELLKWFLEEIEDSDVISGWNCIPIKQSIWTNNQIISIGDIKNGRELYNSDLKKIFPVSKKIKYDIYLRNGQILSSSKDHIFPILRVPNNKYTNLKNEIVGRANLPAFEIIKSEYTTFVEIELRNNTNVNSLLYSNDQLYLAGLIYTDGTLKNKNEKNSGYVIYQSDEKMLETLPLIETKVIGPWKNNYSRNVKHSLIRNAKELIYNGTTKRLNLKKLSTLSYSQFMIFLSGLLDGDGYISTNTIELCNFNNDLPCLYELCLWNGIFCTIRENTLRFVYFKYEDLTLLKSKRWGNFTPNLLDRHSKNKAKHISYKIINNKCFVRVDKVINTHEKVNMIDVQTSTSYFYTMGTKTHNCDGYDVPMMGKRLEKMGKRYFNQLSFSEGNNPRWREVEKFGKIQQQLDLSGRISADYLLIFKKYEVVERPSYKLEAISDEILVDPKTKQPVLSKLEYVGSLADQYRKNFLWFIRYNLRDTEILKGFEDRLGYVEVANQMYHLSTGLFKHVTGTIKLSELATINYCHHELDGLIVNDVHVPNGIEKAKGAFVLLPQTGEHRWVGAIDINSLYPSAIRSNNVSPETIMGQFVETEKAFEEIKKQSTTQLTLEMDSGERLTASAEEWNAALRAKQWTISGYGTVFTQEFKGIMPSILEYWYSTRKDYQKLLKEAKDSGNDIKATYYDKLQYVYKIKLNSYYGSLLNAYFRFYDKRLGESTTATSRVILLHQCAKVAELLDGKYAQTDRLEYDDKGKPHIGYSDKWSVIGGDTDSSYFKTYANNKEEATKIADAVGIAINASFPEFMRETFLCKEGFDNIIKTAREIVADRGIFIEKKRYILHIVDNEGVACDKMKIMGVELKKTNLPKQIALVLIDFIEKYLKGTSWDDLATSIVEYKEELLHTKNIMEIGLPKGIKGLEHYTREYAGDYYNKDKARLPGHVAASIFYNLCREKYDDNLSPAITSDMKIKIFYLNKMYGRFKAIAIPTDIDTVPQWFLDNFKVNMNMHIERLIDNPLNNIVRAIGKITPSRQSLNTDDMLGY